MTQNVCVSVQMDEKGFRDFASFDLLRHNKGWQRPAVFTAILLVCAGICLSQIGKREGAGLLTAVLTIVAIGLPAVYFGTFFSNLSKQIKKLGLPRPFYRLELDAAGRRGGADPAFRSGWPVSRTRPSPPTATLGTPCTAPTAPKRRCTSTSRRIRPIC